MQQRNDITYIGVPFCSGANREGTQHAPQWLMGQLSLLDNLVHILRFPNEQMPLMDNAHVGVKNYDAVLRMITAVKSEVSKVLADEKKVVVLGGDHSISMGSVAGVLEHDPNVGVIWFDAHTDINMEASSPSGNAHGMPLAALMGLCMSGINNQGTKLNPKNVFWVGARDIDSGELEIIRELGIEDHVYTYDRVRQIGMAAVMDDIRNIFKAKGVEHLHLSFDVDGMDPSIVWATGTPVESGMNEIECEEFIEGLEAMPRIISMDFVEYNPVLDDTYYTTGIWCIRTLNKLIEKMK